MFIVLNEHKVFFLTLTLYMPLLLDRFMQMYFFWTLYLCHVYLHVLHVLDDSGFGYEQPSELSSERSDQLTDQHFEITF